MQTGFLKYLCNESRYTVAYVQKWIFIDLQKIVRLSLYFLSDNTHNKVRTYCGKKSYIF